MNHELIVTSFAGGGGACVGIQQALGRSPDIAINHDLEAIGMHAANHRMTRHYIEDVWKVDPRAVCGNRPVALFWLSPDCRHFSRAKQGQPKENKIRGLAWLAVHWAKSGPTAPAIICLENVSEFGDWGPLLPDGTPCPMRRGFTFRRFVKRLQNLGYTVDWQELRACDYGAPTSRKRLFLIARRDGLPIMWPEPSHGPGRLPYRTAGECIDWSDLGPSIFNRKRELAPATLRRIARGIDRFVLNTPDPYIVDTATGRRVAASDYHKLTAERRVSMRTVADSSPPLVAAFLAKHFGGNETPGTPYDEPLSTVTARDHHAGVHLVLNGVEDRSEQVRAFLIAYYGSEQHGQSLHAPLRTVTSHDRFGVISVFGRDHVITDIRSRFLHPTETFAAMGFPPDYIIDRGLRIDVEPPEWFHLSKTAQMRMCGNAVSPPVARAIVEANYDIVGQRLARYATGRLF